MDLTLISYVSAYCNCFRSLGYPCELSPTFVPGSHSRMTMHVTFISISVFNIGTAFGDHEENKQKKAKYSTTNLIRNRLGCCRRLCGKVVPHVKDSRDRPEEIGQILCPCRGPMCPGSRNDHLL